jgi:3-hydroxyisobutyrate dehydrogenase-like beta-hydroxyacid dehydrogenase
MTRKIAIVGAGQSGLQTGIGLLKAGYDVSILSNRGTSRASTAEQAGDSSDGLATMQLPEELDGFLCVTCHSHTDPVVLQNSGDHLLSIYIILDYKDIPFAHLFTSFLKI